MYNREVFKRIDLQHRRNKAFSVIIFQTHLCSFRKIFFSYFGGYNQNVIS